MTVEGWIAEATEALKSGGTVETVVALDVETSATEIREKVSNTHDNYGVREYYKWDDLDSTERQKKVVTDQGWIFTFRPINIHTKEDVEVEIYE